MACENIMEQRVHITNLPQSITIDGLKSVFPNTCNVSEIEIRNNNNFSENSRHVYAFATVSGSENDILDWCERMSSTRVKGLKLSVKKAKANFLSRLQKEISEKSRNKTLDCPGIQSQEFVAPLNIECKDVPKKNVGTDNESKGVNAEAKRLYSLAEKKEFRMQQQETIKNALALDRNSSNKKIIFDDFDNLEEDKSEKVVKKKSTALFADEEDNCEEKDYDFSANKPSFKVVQTSFSTCDERFRLDNRFQSPDDPVIGEEETNEVDEEVAMSTKILDSILGPISKKRKQHKEPNVELIERFDPLKEDHKRYIVEPKEISDNVEETKKPAKAPYAISKERFYHVSEDLSNLLKQPAAEDNEFSLLKMFDTAKSNSPKESNVQDLSGIPCNTKMMSGKDCNLYSSSDEETCNPANELRELNNVPADSLFLNDTDLSKNSADKLFFTSCFSPSLKSSLDFFLCEQKFEPHDVKRKKIKKIVTLKSKKCKRPLLPVGHHRTKKFKS